MALSRSYIVGPKLGVPFFSKNIPAKLPPTQIITAAPAFASARTFTWVSNAPQPTTQANTSIVGPALGVPFFSKNSVRPSLQPAPGLTVVTAAAAFATNSANTPALLGAYAFIPTVVQPSSGIFPRQLGPAAGIGWFQGLQPTPLSVGASATITASRVAFGRGRATTSGLAVALSSATATGRAYVTTSTPGATVALTGAASTGRGRAANSAISGTSTLTAGAGSARGNATAATQGGAITITGAAGRASGRAGNASPAGTAKLIGPPGRASASSPTWVESVSVNLTGAASRAVVRAEIPSTGIGAQTLATAKPAFARAWVPAFSQQTYSATPITSAGVVSPRMLEGVA